MPVTPWTPEFELSYASQTSEAELLARHEEHARLFGLPQIAEALPDGAFCLEVGCGAAGGLLRTLPARLKRVAVDPLISQYQWIPDDLERIAALADKLPFPNGSVNLLICLEALDHCSDLNQFHASIYEFRRVCRKGCRVLFMMPERQEAREGHPIVRCGRDVRDDFMRAGFTILEHRYGREGIWLKLRRS